MSEEKKLIGSLDELYNEGNEANFFIFPFLHILSHIDDDRYMWIDEKKKKTYEKSAENLKYFIEMNSTIVEKYSDFFNDDYFSRKGYDSSKAISHKFAHSKLLNNYVEFKRADTKGNLFQEEMEQLDDKGATKPIYRIKVDDKFPNIKEIIKEYYINNNTKVDALILKQKNKSKGKIQMTQDEYINLLEARNQIILQGPPGTGKTRVAKITAINMINDAENQIENDASNDDIKTAFNKLDNAKLIQFHPSYSYEDFVRGIVAKSNGTSIEYKTENKVLAQMAEDACKDENKDKPFILIIDEINRANLSSVLGELIYALEYRGEPVASMYDIDGDREMTLPSNLYIIGTMNTADRSIGHIDYAIRRRFAFADVLPDAIIVSKNSKFKEVQKLFKNDDGTKASTLSPEFNPDDVMLGHSYFIGDEKELKEKLAYQVIPLLKEYIKDGVLNENAQTKIDELSDEERDEN